MKHTVYNGADVLAGDGISALKRLGIGDPGRCGLITNPTGVLRNMTSTADALAQVCDLQALFGPEHGVRGDVQAGGEVDALYHDPGTGLPVYSFYGKGEAAAAEAMAGLDTIFFDIQDVGARFYTYQYTMTDAMIRCAAAGVRFVVLDRPNPIGGTKAEGTILDRQYASFVGRYPTATRSALTIGEFALCINETEKLGCGLTVVPCEGWRRDMDFDDTDLLFIQPSPNLPTVDTAYAYIGTCILEGTNLSEGRGTTKPFEILGAPWIDARLLAEKLGPQPGLYLREAYFTPTFSKHAGVLCRGLQLHIHDRDAFCPFAAGLRILCAVKELYPAETVIHPGIARLLGTDDILKPDFDAETYIRREAEKVAAWQERTKAYYLYS